MSLRIHAHRFRALGREPATCSAPDRSVSSNGGCTASHAAVPSSPSLTVRRIACARVTVSENPLAPLAIRRRGSSEKPGLAAEMPIANPLAPIGGERIVDLRCAAALALVEVCRDGH
jgi:hypothetical protein